MGNLTERRKQLKEKLLNRSKVFAGWTSLAHPSITEIFAKMPIDFIGIDIEHSTISQEQAQRIISASQGGGTLCLPRVASQNMEMIKRLLDSGADGIIIPMVENKKQVDDIVTWCKYPPAGRRSYGIARAQGYGFDFDGYVKSWNESCSIILQIESKAGVENIDGVLDNPEIDGVMIGPYDLSGSLNMPGKIDSPEVAAACGKVIAACRKYDKACGTQIVDPDSGNISRAFSLGYTFVVLASDVFLLWKWTDYAIKLIEKAGN